MPPTKRWQDFYLLSKKFSVGESNDGYSLLFPIRDSRARKTNNQQHAILHTVSSCAYNKPTFAAVHQNNAHDQLDTKNDADPGHPFLSPD
jgi:hypothetical protein